MKILRLAREFLNKVAEREGFEPSIRDKPHTPLAGERLQPLGHLSGMFQHNAGGFAAKALFSKAC